MVTKRNGGSEAGFSEPIGVVVSPDDVDDSTLGTAGIPTIEPATIVGEADSEPIRKRGRPRGSTKTTSRTASTKASGENLTGILVSVHMMLSHLTKVEELELEEDEAKKLGAALARVQAEYPDMVVLTAKQLAWANLCMVSCAVYGPRMMAYKLRMKNGGESLKQPPISQPRSEPFIMAPAVPLN